MLLLILLTLQKAEFKDTTYLSEADALKTVLPAADRFQKSEIRLCEKQKADLEERLNAKLDDVVTIHAAFRGASLVGYAMAVEEFGCYKPITFMVGVDLDGRVVDIAVMVYREPVGSEVRKRRFLDQFESKGAGSALRVGKDLLKENGATISCNAVARGTRRAVAIIGRVMLQEPVEVKEARPRMGSLLEITAYGEDRDDLKKAVDEAFDAVKMLEARITNYRESELTALSVAELEKPVVVTPAMADFLKMCRERTDETDGAFDVTVGAAVRAWGFFDKKFRVPTDDELAKLKHGNATWTLDGATVKLHERVEFDPGAIGKGLACDLAAESLKKRGVANAFVDFGSSMIAMGRPPKVAGWPVRIRDPFDADKSLDLLCLSDVALSTSGGYEKFFEKDGKRYAHILDPKTLKPAEGVFSASVIDASAARADALSTAVYVRGLDLAKKLKVEALVQADKRDETAGWSKFRNK